MRTLPFLALSPLLLAACGAPKPFPWPIARTGPGRPWR